MARQIHPDTLIGTGPRPAAPGDPLTLDQPGARSPGRSGPRRFVGRGRSALRNFADFSRRCRLQCKQRDPRVWIVAGALALVSALAWIYILALAAAMPRTMPHAMAAMPAMAMMPGAASWTLLQAALVFAMWAVMMVGMMTPSAAPMILLYAGVGRQAQSRGAAFASAAWFALGYLAAWTAFAAAATAAQAALAAHALLSPAMALTSRPLGALVLLAAGAYQLLPVKQACLAHCRAPLQFIQHHGGFPADRRGALRLGLAHGWYCVGCCWVLMALLFVAGVMNTLWIAALSILVLAEKAVPGGRHVARTTGAAALAAGVWMLLA